MINKQWLNPQERDSSVLRVFSFGLISFVRSYSVHVDVTECTLSMVKLTFNQKKKQQKERE